MVGKFLVNRTFLIGIIFLALLSAGCAAEYPRLKIIDTLPESDNCGIAVLPFAYQGKFPAGAEIVSKAFSAELASTPGIDVAREGDILQFYRQNKMYPRNQLNLAQITNLSRQLNVQYVITGDILDLQETDSGREIDTFLSLAIYVYSGSDGRLLWTTYHKRNGDEYRHIMHYGRVNSLTGLIRRMTKEIIQLWTENTIQQCRQL
jgi:polysaccharide biosynthesis protein PelC